MFEALRARLLGREGVLFIRRDSAASLRAHGRMGNRLVAVYESWTQEGGDDGGLAFVKYSPYGWVLSASGRSARVPAPPARHRLVVEAA
jgi:hypothetical protein